jgi:hypothetical protein
VKQEEEVAVEVPLEAKKEEEVPVSEEAKEEELVA